MLHPVHLVSQCNSNYWSVWLFQGLCLLGVINGTIWTQLGKEGGCHWYLAALECRKWGLPVTSCRRVWNLGPQWWIQIKLAIDGMAWTWLRTEERIWECAISRKSQWLWASWMRKVLTLLNYFLLCNSACRWRWSTGVGWEYKLFFKIGSRCRWRPCWKIIMPSALLYGRFVKFHMCNF